MELTEKDMQSRLAGFRLYSLNDAIDKISVLSLTKETKEQYERLIKKIKLYKAMLAENEESRENQLAIKALKKLGAAHPEMRPWLGELVFKNGIEKEKERISLVNKINTNLNEFSALANNPNIDIKEYTNYQSVFEYLRNEVIKNKDLFNVQQYTKLLQDLKLAMSYINNTIGMYNEESEVWENDSFGR